MLSFTADDLPAHERFDHWCEVRGRNLFGVTIELPRERRPDFTGRFAAKDVGEGAIAIAMSGSSYLVKRTQADIARIASDSLYIGRQVVGPGHLDVGRDRIQHVFEGGLTVGHADLPYTATPDGLSGFVFRSLKVPIHGELVLGARVHDLVPALTLQPSPFARLLDAMFDVVTGAPQILPRVDGDVTHLVRLALLIRGRLTSGLPESRAALRVGALYAARAILRRDLRSADLTPERVANELMVSLRQLHLVFEPTGLSFSRTLTMMRIEAAHVLLRNRPTSSIADIAYACGFDSLATFYRVFRKRFGMAPNDLRAVASPAVAVTQQSF